MVEKQDCPYCGKAQIDGRHLRLCSKRPQDVVEPPPVAKIEEPVVEPIIESPKPPASKSPGGRTCPKCGGEIKQLNSFDVRCLKGCGDFEVKVPVEAGNAPVRVSVP